MDDRFRVDNQFDTVLFTRELPNFIEAVLEVRKYLLFSKRDHWLKRLQDFASKVLYAKLQRLPASLDRRFVLNINISEVGCGRFDSITDLQANGTNVRYFFNAVVV